MSARDEAISLLSYYFGRGRDDWSTNNEAEIEAAVDYLLDAAAERMAEKAAAMTSEHDVGPEREALALLSNLYDHAEDIDPRNLLQALRFCILHLQGAPQHRLLANLKMLVPRGAERTEQ